MVVIEQLTVEQRLERLEKYFKNHYHDGYNGMSTPKFDTYCPECGSIEEPIRIDRGIWQCSCGHVFNHDDCKMWYCGGSTEDNATG